MRSEQEQAELVRQLTEAYQAGASLNELERRFDVAHSYIGRLLRRNGVQLRPPGRSDPRALPGRLSPAQQREYRERLAQQGPGQ